MSDMLAIDWQRKAAPPVRIGSVAASCRKGFDVVLAHPGPALGILSVCLSWIILMATSEPLSANRETGPRPLKITAAAAAGPASWIDIVKPISIFNLEAPEFGGLPALTTARRHQSGGGREDVLSLGTLGAPDASMRLSVYRRGREAYAKAPTFADLAHQAADAGFSITRSGLPDLLNTRFGRFEIIDLALAPVSAPATPSSESGTVGAAPPAAKAASMPCTGLRLVLDRPALTLTGLACGANQRGLAHDRLACLLDRLDLASGGDDRPLVEFFAASELKRNGACSGTRLGPDLAHAAWLDDQPPAAAAPAPHVRPATHRKNVRHR